MEYLLFKLLMRANIFSVGRRGKIIRSILRSRGWNKRSADDSLIDIVIPCIERDLITLPFVVKNARRFLTNRTNRIYIIGPDKFSLVDFCRLNNLVFINENNVLPITIKDIDYYSIDGCDRRGWLFQQLLKLAADSFVEAPSYYVVDADTVLMSPQSIIENDKIILNISDEFHKPYRAAYERLLGEKPLAPVSFVSHQMLFEKKTLAKLKEKIEFHTNLPWFNAIINTVDCSEISSFSEYETYGNFLLKYYPNRIKLQYFYNFSLDRAKLKNIDELESLYGDTYKSISFHWHISS
jgi:Family of unknown function (DUF6492)